MSDLLTAPRHMPSARPAATTAVRVIVALVLIFVAANLVTPSEARFVPRITITNDLHYQVEVVVASSEREGWLGLGTVERERSQSFEQVFDLGRAWVFRFSYGGVAGGELTMRREALERAGWRLEVPRAVGERLRAVGLEPSSGAHAD